MGLNPQCLRMQTAPPPASELLGAPTPPPQERIRDNHATTSAKKTLRAVTLLARWRAKAVGQRSAGEDTPRKKETPRLPATPARVLSTPIQTAANHARLVLSTPIPTAANHFLRVRRPPCARSAPAHRPQSSAHETATPTLRLQRPFTVLQNNSQQRTHLPDVTAPAFQHVARCPHNAEEALDAVLVPRPQQAAEAAILPVLYSLSLPTGS